VAYGVIWSAVYLGNFADIDTGFGTFDETDLFGVHGSPSDKLVHHRIDIETNSPSTRIYRDDYGTTGDLSYDLGSGSITQKLDSLVLFRGSVTYTDGTTSASNLTLPVIQTVNGDVFLLAGDTSTHLGIKAVESVDLTSTQSGWDNTFYHYLNQIFYDDTEFVCFATGTLIATPNGEVPVENLRPDDLIFTLDHGTRPLIWRGSRTLSFPRSGDNQKPIEFKAGCLGPDLPNRTLVVSPQHNILCTTAGASLPDRAAQRLTTAKSLTSLKGVREMTGKREVTYHTLLFDRHEVIFANGLPVESLYPGPQALSVLGPIQKLEISAQLPKIYDNLESEFGKHVRPRLKFQEGEKLARAGQLGFFSRSHAENVAATLDKELSS